jgi:dehydration protein DpgD
MAVALGELEFVGYEKRDRVATITMRRPAVLNAMNIRMHEELAWVWEDFEADPEIWVGVLTGSGDRAFSVGQDLKELADRDARGAAGLSSFGSRGKPGAPRLTDRFDITKPLIAKVRGYALGGGFELALACDLIVAARSASFGLVEKVIGLTPAMGGTQRLAERAGSGRAKEFVMAGRPFPAAELERWNVVNRVLPDAGFDEAARALARELAQGPTLAHAATKQVVRDYLEGGVELANDRVSEVAGELFASQDLQAAVRSFLDQGPGKATFLGR